MRLPSIHSISFACLHRGPEHFECSLIGRILGFVFVLAAPLCPARPGKRGLQHILVFTPLCTRCLSVRDPCQCRLVMAAWTGLRLLLAAALLQLSSNPCMHVLAVCDLDPQAPLELHLHAASMHACILHMHILSWHARCTHICDFISAFPAHAGMCAARPVAPHILCIASCRHCMQTMSPRHHVTWAVPYACSRALLRAAAPLAKPQLFVKARDCLGTEWLHELVSRLDLAHMRMRWLDNMQWAPQLCRPLIRLWATALIVVKTGTALPVCMHAYKCTFCLPA